MSKIKENLDLFFLSLINGIFFIWYYETFEKNNYSNNFCQELPKASKMIEFAHLAIFVIFFVIFLINSCLFTKKYKYEIASKWISCILNMGIFISFVGFICLLMNLFYVYYSLGEDCSELNNVVLSDIIILCITLVIFSIYRLCLKSVLTNAINDDDINDENLNERKIIMNRYDGGYGTIVDHEN